MLVAGVAAIELLNLMHIYQTQLFAALSLTSQGKITVIRPAFRQIIHATELTAS
eukprot:SAG31_NODE_1390_length_8539_cov_12.684834_4_plen_54_part_00